MESYCDRILREKDPPVMPPPEDRHVKIALAAFEGKTIGEIRAEYPKTSIKMIAESIRTTRDAIRRGQAPELVKEQFPGLIEDQKQFKVAGKYAKQSALSKAADAISTSLQLVKVTSFREFLDLAKERFAPIAVPLTMQKIIDGVEREDPTMIKLSTEVFSLNPRKGGINQQFNFPPGSGSEEVKRSTNPERRVAFFEDIVRRQRAKIDEAAPAAAIDVEVIDPDDEGSDEE